MSYKILQGNNLDILPGIADSSIDSIVTDPPYELGFMGKKWDSTGIAYSVKLWKECLRVLKPGGYLLSFGGTRTYHRMACAIEDAGFEIRDQIQWLYGSGFPKSHNLTGEHAGKGTALKPANEPICVARKPIRGSVIQTVLEFGTGALNIDQCRIEGEPWVFGTQTDIKGGGYGSNRPSDGDILAKNVQSNPLGRWPANVIHDGSPEVLECFPDAKGQMGPAKNDRSDQGNNVYGKMSHVSNRPEPRIEIEKSAARFFYCAKASKLDRDEGCDDLNDKQGGMLSNTSGQHITRRDGGAPGMVKNNHPTVKPVNLMRYLCRLVTPQGGAILDPFAGSGSTLKGAMLEGYDVTGIEANAEYIPIIEARCKHIHNYLNQS